MYAGGSNPPSTTGLQESHASGYPNDLERLGYDFHAVIALTILPAVGGLPPTVVLLAEPGIGPQISVDSDTRVDGFGDEQDVADPSERVFNIDPDVGSRLRIDAAGHALDVLVLPSMLRHQLWVLDTANGRELVRSGDDLIVDGVGQIAVWSARPAPVIETYSPHHGAFTRVELHAVIGRPGLDPAVVRPLRTPNVAPPTSYGRHQGRASAPAPEAIDRLAHRFGVRMPATYVPGQEATVEIEWAGDVGVVMVADRVVADRFWDGSVWELDVVDLDLGCGFEIGIVPLRHDAAV